MNFNPTMRVASDLEAWKLIVTVSTPGVSESGSTEVTSTSLI